MGLVSTYVSRRLDLLALNFGMQHTDDKSRDWTSQRDERGSKS